MRVRKQLFQMVLDIAKRDNLTFWDIARMCYTSRPRAWKLLHGHIELFNSETLIDILARLGVTLEVCIANERRYRKHDFPPRVLQYGTVGGNADEEMGL